MFLDRFWIRLKWTCNYRCEIKLQGQHIGEAHGPSKAAVRNLAAADALFKLYESQSVVKVRFGCLFSYQYK